MGYLTTFTIHNDHYHELKKDPQRFTKLVLEEGFHKAFYNNETVQLDGISIEPSRHADDRTLYLHWGNMVRPLNGYSKYFSDLVENNPKLAEDIVKTTRKLLNKSKKT